MHVSQISPVIRTTVPPGFQSSAQDVVYLEYFITIPLTMGISIIVTPGRGGGSPRISILATILAVVMKRQSRKANIAAKSSMSAVLHHRKEECTHLKPSRLALNRADSNITLSDTGQIGSLCRCR